MKMKKDDKIPDNYNELFHEIKRLIHISQYEALKSVNKKLISLYWSIGEMITLRQAGNTWGKSVVERLSKDLQVEFPGIKGFSVQNLWYMRQFYTEYCDNINLQPLVGEISWTKNIIIISKCKNSHEREFYLRMTRRYGWTKTVLIQKIESRTFEKTMINQTNFDETLPEPLKQKAKLAVKDEYTFDFLELGDEYTEREFEDAIIFRIEKFLREMGGMFTFVGRQYRLEASDREYFIDILLYHRGLKCLTAIELKIGEFKPEYIGKMQFYLAILDDTARVQGENPSIGIILCKTKDKTIVEYALRESNKPIGVAEYDKESQLPDNFYDQLPSPEQISILLADI
jgi:predicted nuclease of restriction endonuclease-like (RecB) superfamily